MIALILIIWALIAISQAYGLWWLLALVLVIFLPKTLDRTVLYIWGGIALSTLGVGAWLILFCVLAAVDVLSDEN